MPSGLFVCPETGFPFLRLLFEEMLFHTREEFRLHVLSNSFSAKYSSLFLYIVSLLAVSLSASLVA